MTTEVRQIYIRQDGAWQPIGRTKVRRDGAWAAAKGVFHAGSWHVVTSLEFKNFNIQVDARPSSSSPGVIGAYKIITSS